MEIVHLHIGYMDLVELYMDLDNEIGLVVTLELKSHCIMYMLYVEF